MTAASGDPGETPQNGREGSPATGGFEAPPIEQTGPVDQTPAYGGFEPLPPTYPAYQAPGGQLPPPPFTPGPGSPPSPYPPPGAYPPPPGAYPPPPGAYPPPPPTGYVPSVEYGMPYPGDYGFPGTQKPGTNTLAMVSLVSSLLGLLCGIGAIVGIVCGAVSLNQIKRTREDGHGLAVAGITIGVAALVFQVVLILFTN